MNTKSTARRKRVLIKNSSRVEKIEKPKKTSNNRNIKRATVLTKLPPKKQFLDRWRYDSSLLNRMVSQETEKSSEKEKLVPYVRELSQYLALKKTQKLITRIIKDPNRCKYNYVDEFISMTDTLLDTPICEIAKNTKNLYSEIIHYYCNIINYHLEHGNECMNRSFYEGFKEKIKTLRGLIIGEN